MTGRSAGARPRWLLAALCLAATFLAYLPALGNEFAMDDRFVVKSVLDDGTRNEMVAELRPLGEYFRKNYWSATGSDHLFRPVTILSYALTRAALVPAGASQAQEAFPHHLLNVLLHLVAVVVTYRLLRGVRASGGAAWLGATFFGLHAIHSEAVAGIVGRADLLAFVCGGGAVLLLRASTGHGGGRRILAVAGAALCFFLAFGSKESALAWVPFYAIYTAAGSARGLLRGGLLALAVSALPLGIWLWLRAQMIATMPDVPPANFIVNPLAYTDATVRILTAVKIWAWGALLTVAPFSLSADYGPAVFTVVESAADPGFLLGFATLGGTLAITLAGFRRWPLVFLAGGTFLGFSFITSNVPFAIGTIFGERLLYIPSLGLSFAVVALAGRIPPGRGLLIARGAAAAWLVASAAMIWSRSPVWKNNETLFRAEVASETRSARMHAGLASILVQQGDLPAATRHLREAVTLEPAYAGGWNNLGDAYGRAGRLGDAEQALRRGLAAPRAEPRVRAELYCNLGLVHTLRARPGPAITAFRRSLAADERFGRSRIELLKVGMDALPPQELEALLARGRVLHADDPHWPLFAALLAHRRGDWAAARRGLESSLRAFPPHGERSVARLVLADSLVKLGERASALRVLDALIADPTARPDLRARARATAAALRD